MKVLDCNILVPTLIVEGQDDNLILGSNVIKHLIRVLKVSGDFWENVSLSDKMSGEDESLFQLLTTTDKWKGGETPDKVGFVKLKHAVTLLPMKEHLVWGRLPVTSAWVLAAHTVPRTVMVGRIVTPLWGDGWVPVRVINPSSKPVMLKRNCKIADVSACVALEDFDADLYENNSDDNVKCTVTRTVDQSDSNSEKSWTVNSECPAPRASSSGLCALGLQDIDVNSSNLSPFWKGKLIDLLAKYEPIFSRHSLDCGNAKDFVHSIALCDNKPFRLPYWRLSPSHYEKLRMALNDMERERNHTEVHK
ncbi:hypothetical protein L3Q82_002290 [Scortum barcoo]|uniref:Uncharacterized protein n=1 Tax=Scortum barcoo TaxID=214431 RepID=A0ACB8VXX2_9TELE|nr:hypothetical protein L3Q82_002290 [Scortum barcoo]